MITYKIKKNIPFEYNTWKLKLKTLYKELAKSKSYENLGMDVSNLHQERLDQLSDS